MSKVQIDAAGLKSLYEHAVKANTLEHWGLIAVEWSGAAEQEIERLRAELESEKRCSMRLAQELAALQVIREAGEV